MWCWIQNRFDLEQRYKHITSHCPRTLRRVGYGPCTGVHTDNIKSSRNVLDDLSGSKTTGTFTQQRPKATTFRCFCTSTLFADMSECYNQNIATAASFICVKGQLVRMLVHCRRESLTPVISFYWDVSHGALALLGSTV